MNTPTSKLVSTYAAFLASVSWESLRDVAPETPFTFTLRLTVENIKWLLSLNVKNRKPKPNMVNTLIKIMVGGRFLLTGDSIAVSRTADVNGVMQIFLIDGQTRLTAALRALLIDPTLVLEVLLTMGLDPKAQEATNSGTPRSAQDNLVLRGVEFPKLTATVVARCASLFLGRPFSVRVMGVYDPVDALFKKSVEWAIDSFHGIKSLEKGPISGGMAFVHASDPKLAIDCTTQLIQMAKTPDGEAYGVPKWHPMRTFFTHLKTGKVDLQTSHNKMDESIARRLLNSVKAVKDGKMTKHAAHDDGPEGLNFFRDLLDTPEARQVFAVPIIGSTKEVAKTLQALSTSEMLLPPVKKKVG